MNLETLLVARHQQRRVLQVSLIAHELCGKPRSGLLCLPLYSHAEETALPHIGKALAIVQRGNMLLKREAVAALVCRCRVRLPQHFAEVYEVTLRGGALGESACFPAFDEFQAEKGASDSRVFCWRLFQNAVPPSAGKCAGQVC